MRDSRSLVGSDSDDVVQMNIDLGWTDDRGEPKHRFRRRQEYFLDQPPRQPVIKSIGCFYLAEASTAVPRLPAEQAGRSGEIRSGVRRRRGQLDAVGQIGGMAFHFELPSNWLYSASMRPKSVR